MSAGDPKTHVLPAQATLEIASASLHVVDGPDRSAKHRLSSGSARIGTAKNAQLRLTDPTVSRVHCEIRVAHGHPGAVRIVDEGSTNGTFVDGVRVLDALLRGGEAIRIGATTLRLDVGGEPAHVQLSSRQRFGDVIGGSIEMRRIYALLERIAPGDATVLIQGETGTGKEVVARAVHDASKRAASPFVAVDCGAIAETLIESELFGHVRGAFSGAAGDRRGLFEEAHGGTLFLDEIGELPLPLQPKLLRVLETREVRRVGANVGKKVDVRVLAATNRSLARSVNEGTFREDLYYRLAVMEIPLPPLRARREDVVPLARHFWTRFAGDRSQLPDALVPTLMARSWPGNVRELRNFIERSVSLGWREGRAAGPSDDAPPPALDALVPSELPLKEAREAWTGRFEALYVAALLRKTAGNVTRAAQLAGVTRRQIQRLVAEHGLRGLDADEATTDDE